jgi:hypothetical protein
MLEGVEVTMTSNNDDLYERLVSALTTFYTLLVGLWYVHPSWLIVSSAQTGQAYVVRNRSVKKIPHSRLLVVFLSQFNFIFPVSFVMIIPRNTTHF